MESSRFHIGGRLARLALGMLLMFFMIGVAQTQETAPPKPAAPAANPPAHPAAAPVFPQASTPLELAIQSAVKQGTHPKLHWGHFSDVQALLETLYQTHGFAPLWLHDNKPSAQAKAAIASLSTADDKGLNAADYDIALLSQWLNTLNNQAEPNPQELASFDTALSISLARYANHLHKGRVNPKRVNFALEIEPKNEDIPALLRKMASNGNPDRLLAGLEPKLKLYEQLKTALAHYRRLAKEPAVGVIALPNKFKPGDRNADVPKMRKLLALAGDLPAEESGNASEAYDKTLAEAVKRFQTRHGLTPDGIIGKTTLAQMNVPLGERVKPIQLGLERLRWLPDHIDGRFILVNVPSFQLYGYHQGSGADRPDLAMNVIVGEAIDGRSTPVFHSDMTYVNFRPYWNVPYAIAVKEYVPMLRKNPGYLSRHNMEIVSNFSANASVHAASGGSVEGLAAGTLKLRQRPGPKNALGLVKFTFPNTNNVYLHSTPSQGLFKRTRRDFSHGCIRVEFPVKLAEFVLQDHEDWTRERIESAMQQDPSKIVTLKTPIPVYILYFTVMADADGRTSFYEDIYGHDSILSEELAKGFP